MELSPTNSTVAPTVPVKRLKPLSIRKKFFFSIAVTTSVFIVIESVLAISGVKPQYLSVDPYVGFRDGTPLFVQEAEVYRTNPTKRMFFNDQHFAVKKSRNTYRIFCLGGSTTFGHPYDDTTSFVGWLRARLQDADPERDWEVVNCGGISYASYRICRLMQELTKFKPDLFIFYEGHNEFLEERTYGDFKHRGFATRIADCFVMRTRIGAAAAAWVGCGVAPPKCSTLSPEVDTILEHSVGPDKYHRDIHWRNGVIRHFGESLNRACAIARSCGAQMVFVKPASNIRDFSPFKSQHGTIDAAGLSRWNSLVFKARTLGNAGNYEDAATNLVDAANLDPAHAETQWEAGRGLFEAGEPLEARRFFQRAIDEDICPLRAISEILNTIDSTAREQHVPLVDFRKLIEDDLEHTRGHRLPGNESFLDHVHPTIENNRRLAWALFDVLVSLHVVKSTPGGGPVIERTAARVLKNVDSTKQALALVQVAQVLSWAGKNSEASKPLDRAEEISPGLSDVMYYRGRLCDKAGKTDDAFRCYKDAVSRNKDDYFALSELGRAYLKRNDPQAALPCFEHAVRVTPNAAPASFRSNLHVGFGLACAATDRPEVAAIQFRIALQICPSSTEAHLGLQALQDEK